MTGWLTRFADRAVATDRLSGQPRHLTLLAAGLFGEVGGILAEQKKRSREGYAHARYRERLSEEIGDALWYLARLTSVAAPDIFSQIALAPATKEEQNIEALLPISLAAAACRILEGVDQRTSSDLHSTLLGAWSEILTFASVAGIDAERASTENLKKTGARWPAVRAYEPLFDGNLSPEE